MSFTRFHLWAMNLWGNGSSVLSLGIPTSLDYPPSWMVSSAIHSESGYKGYANLLIALSIWILSNRPLLYILTSSTIHFPSFVQFIIPQSANDLLFIHILQCHVLVKSPRDVVNEGIAPSTKPSQWRHMSVMAFQFTDNSAVLCAKRFDNWSESCGTRFREIYLWDEFRSDIPYCTKPQNVKYCSLRK